MTETTPKTIYLDIESGGLRDDDRPWEIALVIDGPGGEHSRHLYYVEDFLPSHADPKALELNGFYNRHPLWVTDQSLDPRYGELGLTGEDLDVPVKVVLEHEHCIARMLEPILRGNRVYGCNVGAYDKPIVTAMLNRIGATWTAHYRPICVTTWAAGVAGLDPETPNSVVGAHFGVSRDQHGTVHGALPDALYARSLRHAAMASAAARRLTETPA